MRGHNLDDSGLLLGTGVVLDGTAMQQARNLVSQYLGLHDLEGWAQQWLGSDDTCFVQYKYADKDGDTRRLDLAGLPAQAQQGISLLPVQPDTAGPGHTRTACWAVPRVREGDASGARAVLAPGTAWAVG